MKVCNIRARTVTVCGACSCSSTISNLARSTSEPIYITKNGEGDGVFMNIDAFEKREQYKVEILPTAWGDLKSIEDYVPFLFFNFRN